jgi:hypothetical protein
MNAAISFRFRRATKISRTHPGNPAAIAVLEDAIVSITVIEDDGVTVAGKLQNSPAGSPEQLNPMV